jgi:hypothetical protein
MEGVATAKIHIAIAKSKFESGNNNEELLKANQELYEFCVADHCQEVYLTIRAGIDYAMNLQDANRGGGDARDLLQLVWILRGV